MTCVCPSLVVPELGQSDPVRVGSDRDGGERPAADGRAGPFRPERTPFFPSHSSLRDSFHYGKNDIVLSGIGTDRPARRRPAALERPGPSRGAAGAGGGEMTMVSTKAARDKASFGRIRQSSHCQQEEQSRAAAAVGGYHEIGCKGT